MYDEDVLWDVFGLVADVKVSTATICISHPRLILNRNISCQPFTYYFPRADIHELLSPDILHQLIKDTFKDHLVSWAEEYIKITAASEREAKEILDDIDRRYVVRSARSPGPAHRGLSDSWPSHLSLAFADFLKGATSSNGQEMIRKL